MFNFDLQRFANIKTVKDGAVAEGLPSATSSTKGGVMVGTGLSVDSQGKISVPTATTTSNGLMTSTEKSKLAGIATGAEVNKIETIKVNGAALTPDSNRVVEITTTSVDISNKVDKVEGKGLSTNDYTTEEKSKLAGIADNANNYSLPNATTTTKGGVIVGTGLSVNNSTLSVATATTGTIGGIKLGNGVTTATGGVVSIRSATASQNGLMTSDQASKLAGIATGAEVNAINTVKVNNTALSVSSKAVNIDLTDYAKQHSAPTFYGINITEGDISIKNQNLVFTAGTANESIIFSDDGAIDENNYTGNAATATKLKTGRTLKVSLNSTSASTAFDGTANITNIGIAGTLPVANGGTGATTAAAARTNLGLGTLSTLSSVALGSNVTGTLGTANGGTGTNNLANITVGAATKDGSGHTITSYYAPLASPTFTGEVTAPTIKGLDELQFHYHVNTPSTGAFTFTGIKTFYDHGSSTGKSMMVTAGQALLLGSGEAVANVMRLNGTADSIPGLTTEYLTGECTAVMSDNQISFWTNTGDLSNTKQWIFGADGRTTMPGRVTAERYLLSGGWLGKPANDPIIVSYTNDSSTTTIETSNSDNILLVGNNRLFLIAGEGGTYKFAKYSNKITCRDYTLGRVPVWIMPQGSALDLSEPEDSTNNGEHMFVVADRNVYIYTNLQQSTDLDDNTGLTEVTNMPHKFMFTYTGQFQAPVVRSGKLLLTNALEVEYGGTGLTASPSMLVSLGSTTAANVLAASPRPGVTGTLGTANGGTGTNNLANVSVGSAAKATLDGAGNTIATTYAKLASPTFTGTVKGAAVSLSGAITLGSALSTAYGGTGTNNLANVSVGSAAKATLDGSGHTITSYYAPLANPVFTGTVKAPNVSLSGAATIPTMTVSTKITGGAVHTTTSKGDLGWSSNTTDGLQVITKNSLAYWNGQYQSGKSNLLYCSLGAFGTAATTDASIYPSLASNNTFSGTNTFNKRVCLNERVIMTSGMVATSLGTVNTWASAKDNAGTTYTPTGGIAWYWATNSATGIFGFSRDNIGTTAHNMLITTGEQLVLSAGERGGLDVFRYVNTADSVFKQAFDTKGKIHLVAEYGMEFITGAASTPQYFSFYYDGSASMPGALNLGQPLSVANGGTGATSAADARTALDVPQASKINSIWYTEWGSGMVDTATKVVSITGTGHNFTLHNGQMLIVYVSAATTDSSVTTSTSINVNSTGVKMVKYWGTSGGTNIPNNKWPKGIYMLIYAESCWRFISSGEHNYPNNA